MVTIRNNSKSIITLEIPCEGGHKDYVWSASVDAQGGGEPHIVRVDEDEWARLKEHPAVEHFRSNGTFEVFGELG